MNKELNEKLELLKQEYDNIYKPYNEELEQLEKNLQKLLDKRQKINLQVDDLREEGKVLQARKLLKDMEPLMNDINVHYEDIEYIKEILKKGSPSIKEQLAAIEDKRYNLFLDYQSIYFKFLKEQGAIEEEARLYKEQKIKEHFEKHDADLKNYRQLNSSYLGEYYFTKI